MTLFPFWIFFDGGRNLEIQTSLTLLRIGISVSTESVHQGWKRLTRLHRFSSLSVFSRSNCTQIHFSVCVFFFCVCVFACVWVCVFACVWVHVYLHVYDVICICMCTSVCISMYMGTRVYVWVHVEVRLLLEPRKSNSAGLCSQLPLESLSPPLKHRDLKQTYAPTQHLCGC